MSLVELDSPDANLGAIDPKSAPRGMDLTKLASAELLALFESVLVELRARGLVRSSNNPVADYAESLVAQALGLKLETKSTTGYDAIGPDGLKYEVKGRRPTPANKSRQLSVIRGLDNGTSTTLPGCCSKRTCVCGGLA